MACYPCVTHAISKRSHIQKVMRREQASTRTAPGRSSHRLSDRIARSLKCLRTLTSPKLLKILAFGLSRLPSNRLLGKRSAGQSVVSDLITTESGIRRLAFGTSVTTSGTSELSSRCTVRERCPRCTIRTSGKLSESPTDSRPCTISTEGTLSEISKILKTGRPCRLNRYAPNTPEF